MNPVFKIILLISLILFSYESCLVDEDCNIDGKEICEKPEAGVEGTCSCMRGYVLNEKTSKCEKVLNFKNLEENDSFSDSYEVCCDLYDDSDSYDYSSDSYDDSSDNSYDDSSDNSYDSDDNSKSNFIKFTIFTFACLFL